MIYGGRISLLMGLVPVGLATCIGGFLGLLAGFTGGWINTLIMRIIDVFYAFPSVLLAVAISPERSAAEIAVSLIALDAGVHSAAVPRLRGGNNADLQPRLRRSRPGERRLEPLDPYSTTCCAMCWRPC